jgi:AcrR family transcriptional regulator
MSEPAIPTRSRKGPGRGTAHGAGGATAAGHGAGGAAADPARRRRRGRPRSERATQAILKAAADLLEERGLGRVSVDEIAARAGVSKATIYRWWDSKEALALDAFRASLGQREGPAPDTGTLAGDLLVRLRARIRLLASDPASGSTLVALVAEAAHDPALRETYREHLLDPLRHEGHEVFRKAIERGEIPADTDVDVALDLVYGALNHRLFQGHAPLDDHFARTVVDIVVRGLTAPRA